MEKNSKIFVTGHRGLVGSNLVKELVKQGYTETFTVDREQCDLLDRSRVRSLFNNFKPEYVFNCAGKVGGINANNTQSAEFIYENLVLQTNVIDACFRSGVSKLMALGSSCIYPKFANQPIHEDDLLAGKLEETNVGYAVAKIAGLTMCRMYRKQYGCDFISVMPTNLYGPGDNFNMIDGHVLPSLIRRFHEAKINRIPEVEVWGSGRPLREFLYVEDLAKGLIYIMNNYSQPDPINIGTGAEVSICNLAQKIQLVVGYEGNIKWNTTFPDGTMQKVLDIGKLNGLGWKAETSLESGLIKTYRWFVENYQTARK